MKVKVDHYKKLDFKEVEFSERDPTHTGVVLVVEVLIVEELGAQHDAVEGDGEREIGSKRGCERI